MIQQTDLNEDQLLDIIFAHIKYKFPSFTVNDHSWVFNESIDSLHIYGDTIYDSGDFVSNTITIHYPEILRIVESRFKASIRGSFDDVSVTFNWDAVKLSMGAAVYIIT